MLCMNFKPDFPIENMKLITHRADLLIPHISPGLTIICLYRNTTNENFHGMLSALRGICYSEVSSYY